MEKTPTRWWDIPSIFLLLFLVLFSAWRLLATHWTEGLYIVPNLSVLGLCVGLALGQSNFKKRCVILLSLAYMFVFFIWQWLWLVDFAKEQNYLGEQLLILFSRITTNINEFFAGHEIEDQFFITTALCFPYWFVGLYSGFQMTRHANIVACVLPAGVLMLFIHNAHYTSKSYGWMFGVYLFVALLFISRQKFIRDKIKWLKERVSFSRESGLDITSTSLYLSFALIIVAWMMPYTLPAKAEAREVWHKTFGDWFTGERFENIISSIDKEKKPQPRNFQTKLDLGTQTSQSEAVVFLVFAPSKAEDYPRLYWRGQIYDHFENGQWTSTADLETKYINTQDGNFRITDTEKRVALTFTYEVYTEGQFLLYSAGQPLSTDHNAIILHSKISDKSELVDISALRASPALEVGDLYRVSVVMANPLIAELQNAGDDYPTWVTEKYLQLPDDFSPRIRDLALEISASADTPFDKATAITNYLRSEIKYASAITIPDEVTDPLEYFLFDKKYGFCNYSASAEVLMLRAVGIPARLAVGYAQGEPNSQNSIYTVRERDLHAWPEVYFPEYGWVEFEPTGNQQALNRPVEHAEVVPPTFNPLNPARLLPLEDELELPVDVAAENEQVEEQVNLLTQGQKRWFGFISLILCLGVAVFWAKRKYAPNKSVAHLLKYAFEKWDWKIPLWLNNFLIWATLPSVERNFYVINTSLKWFGKEQALHATAIERAHALQKILPTASDSIKILLQQHQYLLFSQHDVDEVLARRAAWDVLYQTFLHIIKPR